MTEVFAQTLILFVDMLGFASLVEKEGEDLNSLNPIFTDIERHAPEVADTLLGYRFINFHRCLNQARRRLQDSGAGTAVVFSDSAFFRIDTLDLAIQEARALMYELIMAGIPARIGLASGSYRMLRFMTDTSSQVSFHISQFLGTGVVRAHAAEQSGLPGLRVILHPSLNDQIDPDRMRLIRVIPPDRPLRLAVEWEVNYLEEHGSGSGPNYDDCIAFDELRWMWGGADPDFHYHYHATYEAWQRMRGQLGRPPYPWEKFLDRDEYDFAHGIRPRPEPAARMSSEDPT